jgi:hypothetical protein
MWLTMPSSTSILSPLIIFVILIIVSKARWSCRTDLTVYELKDAGYSVMRTSHGFYVRVTGSDEHRSATRMATDKNILHVNGTEELRGAPLINYENLLVAGTMNAKHTRGHIAINMEPNRVQLPIFCKDFHRVH